MKKINKYIREEQTSSLAEALKSYKKSAQSFRKNPMKKLGKKISPLSLIIPFAAASITPFAVKAQCGLADINAGGGIGDGEHWLIDIDGNGSVDFELDAQPSANPINHDLYVRPIGTNEVAGFNMSGYWYATKFNNGDPIASGGAWSSPVFAVMDFQANGQWHGSGIVTGFLGVRVGGNQLGFIEVGWNNNDATITISAGTMGLESVGPTSVNAGDCLALPVELTRFEGTMRSDFAELEWTTDSEENNKGFEIQRSSNGQIFKTIGFVEGQGYSNARIDYTFQDDNIRKGQDYYYRLQQVDFWGRSEASEVINLKALEGAAIRLDVSPNPVAGDFIQVEYHNPNNSSAQLTVFNVQGKLMISQVLEADTKNNTQLNIENLPAGSYFLKVEEANEVVYKQFIKS